MDSRSSGTDMQRRHRPDWVLRCKTPATPRATGPHSPPTSRCPACRKISAIEALAGSCYPRPTPGSHILPTTSPRTEYSELLGEEIRKGERIGKGNSRYCAQNRLRVRSANHSY